MTRASRGKVYRFADHGRSNRLSACGECGILAVDKSPPATGTLHQPFAPQPFRPTQARNRAGVQFTHLPGMLPARTVSAHSTFRPFGQMYTRCTIQSQALHGCRQLLWYTQGARLSRCSSPLKSHTTEKHPRRPATHPSEPFHEQARREAGPCALKKSKQASAASGQGKKRNVRQARPGRPCATAAVRKSRQPQNSCTLRVYM